MISIENAEHYIWSEICEGWHRLRRDELSVIHRREGFERVYDFRENIAPRESDHESSEEEAEEFFIRLILYGDDLVGRLDPKLDRTTLR